MQLTFLTKQEIKTRKIWLLIALIGFGFSLIGMGFTALQASNLNNLELIKNSISFLAEIIYLTTIYQLCYKRHATFLLTVQLVGNFCALLAMILFCIAMFSSGLAYGLAWTIGASIVFLPFLYIYNVTRRMRRINKVLKCLKTHPNESDELIQAFQNVADLKDLDSLSEKYQSVPPLLRYLVMRQKNLRKEELQSV